MRKKILLVIVMIVSLFVARFFNLYLMWNLMSLEYGNELSDSIQTGLQIKNNTMAEELNKSLHSHFPSIFHLGFATASIAEKYLKDKVSKSESPLSIVSYFDLTHPLGLLIYNKYERVMVSSHFLQEINKGLTRVFISRSDIAKIITNGNVRFETVAVFKDTTSWMNEKTDEGLTSGLRMSFNDVWQTRGVSIVLSFIYFYFPLIIISIIGILKNHSIFLSFLYYIEMAALFGIKLIFVKSQYLITFRVTKFFVFFLMFLVLLGFLFGVFSLIKNIKKQNLSFATLLLIIGFVSLPFFLRF